MSKLEELIQQYCPEGVEYKKISDLTYYEQPGPFIVESTDYDAAYKTPVLTAGQSFILGYTNENNGIYYATKDNPVIIFDDFTGAFKWVDFSFKVKSSAMKIIKANEQYTSLRYLFHVMGFLNFSSNEHKRLWISIYSELEVPVPPMEVQREIVHILDSFTFYTSELSAELSARREQYNYYRDMLLSESKGEKKKIKDICDIYLGLTYTPTYVDKGIMFLSSKNISKDYLDLSDTKYISEDEFNNSTANAKPRKGDILFTRVGSNLGHPVILDIDNPVCIFVSLGYLRVKDCNISNRYLKHWMTSNLFMDQVIAKTKVAPKANLNTTWLKEFAISLPSCDEQEAIANTLDTMEYVFTNIDDGLPAEIEARQKQYEYYRDKLLDFKRIN